MKKDKYKIRFFGGIKLIDAPNFKRAFELAEQTIEAEIYTVERITVEGMPIWKYERERLQERNTWKSCVI